MEQKLEISQEQFDRALDILCEYEPWTGFSLGDALVAICLVFEVKLPDGVSTENAVHLIDSSTA